MLRVSITFRFINSGGNVSQPPGRYRGQPQEQPPWNGYQPTDSPRGYPQTGYPPPGSPLPRFPPTSPRRASSPGRRGPQMPLPRRARRKSPRKRNVVLFVIAAVFAIAAIASAVDSNGNSVKHLTAAESSATAKASSRAASPASATSKTIANAEDTCYKRPPTPGAIYVRMIMPGVSAQAREMAGGWVWNDPTNKCLTSVQIAIAAAPLSAGYCTQVGYVADNPGYDPNAAAAAPLANVVTQAGPACATAPQSRPAQTTPAAAPATTPAPPASTAPAGCNPLSDEGTCYEPGEYCRDDDHGASGVAGDGEPIICEDNDGWRWEPA